MNLERFNKLTAKLQALSIKERVGVTLALICVIFALWKFLLMGPMIAEEKKLTDSLNQKHELVTQVSDQLNTMSQTGQDKKDIKNRQRLESMIKQLEMTDQRLHKIASNLIPPDQMANVLEMMLNKSDGLTIRSLKGLGATPIPEPDKNSENDHPENDKKSQLAETGPQDQQAWRHGLRVEFSGSYLETVKYLQSLEALDWQFYWDSVELDADNYPIINTAIRIYTLSLDKEWIGV